MNDVVIWRKFGQNDLIFVQKCSVLAAMFCEDDPNILFECMSLYEGQLLDRAQFYRAIGV
jgi:hypothetical protein